MTEQVQEQTGAEELTQETFTQAVEGLAADLGQHGHAAAKLENPDHVNPHDQEVQEDFVPEDEVHVPDEAAIQAENEALGHDNAEQFQQ